MGFATFTTKPRWYWRRNRWSGCISCVRGCVVHNWANFNRRWWLNHHGLPVARFIGWCRECSIFWWIASWGCCQTNANSSLLGQHPCPLMPHKGRATHSVRRRGYSYEVPIHRLMIWPEDDTSSFRPPLPMKPRMGPREHMAWLPRAWVCPPAPYPLTCALTALHSEYV